MNNKKSFEVNKNKNQKTKNKQKTLPPTPRKFGNKIDSRNIEDTHIK